MSTREQVIHLTRHPNNPILVPQFHRFYRTAIYNPAVLFHQGRYYMLFRGQFDAAVSGLIGLAVSTDGVHFHVHPSPVLVPEFSYERLGCEDPRLVYVDGRFVCTYVGKDAHGDQEHVCMAVSTDMYHWHKLGVVLYPRREQWYERQVKAGALFPFRVNGQYAMLFLGERRPWQTSIGIAFSQDFVHWTIPDASVVLSPRPGYFDSMGVEPGPPPLLTKWGILVVYNGWNEEKVHCIGCALLDPSEPRRVLWRSDEPLLRPERTWEREGQVPNVVFATGMVYNAPDLWVYYGAADRVVGLAVGHLEM